MSIEFNVLPSLISRVVTMKQFLYKCCIDMQYYLQNLNISFVIFHRLGTQCDPDAHGKSLTISYLQIFEFWTQFSFSWCGRCMYRKGNFFPSVWQRHLVIYIDVKDDEIIFSLRCFLLTIHLENSYQTWVKIM